MLVLDSLQDPQVIALLKSGAVGVIPTDTIYGLAARAEDQNAVTKLYSLKQREHKPGTVIAASIEQLIALGLNQSDLRTVADYWPDFLSFIIPTARDLNYLDQGLGDVAVRIPKDDALRNLLAQTGPLVTSSANQPGETPSANLDEAKACFGDQVAFYVDGGDRGGRPPSTVARLVGGKLTVLRQGAAKLNDDR